MTSAPKQDFADTLCLVLHYGNEEDTYECLASLNGNTFLDVVVIDNDPSQSFELPQQARTGMSLVRTGGQMGFSAANNFGFQRSRKKKHKYVLLLNNDTVVVDSAIWHLRNTMENDKIGLVGPTMPYFENPEHLWSNGGKISDLLVTIDGIRKEHPGKITDVDYLPGAAFLTRSSLWEDIGGLPERYFLAFEEAEFALEVKKRGFRVVVNQEATVFHKVGMSSDRQPMYYYNTVRNRIRFGEYLYGSRLGRQIGALSGLIRSVTPLRFQLWLEAVSDEFSGLPLDRDSLMRIKRTFPVECHSQDSRS